MYKIFKSMINTHVQKNRVIYISNIVIYAQRTTGRDIENVVAEKFYRLEQQILEMRVTKSPQTCVVDKNFA